MVGFLTQCFLFQGSACSSLTVFDQLLDLLSAFAADLLVEGWPAGSLDSISALFSDLFVELGTPLRLDRLASLSADLFVEGAPALWTTQSRNCGLPPSSR